MAQSYDKYELDNDNGKAFRLALNDILFASATQNSGDDPPNTSNTSYAYQVWVDTSQNIVKIRDAAAAGSWYSLYSVDSDGKPTGAVAYGSYTIATNDTAGTGGTTAITVDTSQRVGIQQTNPAAPLDVGGAIFSKTSTAGISDQSITFTESGSGNSYGVRLGHASNTELAFERYDGGWVETVRIDGAGRVGIGADPSSKLHLSAASGSVQMQINSGGNPTYIGHDSGFTGLDLAAGGGIRFRYHTGAAYANAAAIDTSGRLLVGTTTSESATSYIQSVRTSGSSNVYVESKELANSQITSYIASAKRSGGSLRFSELGLYKHSGITETCSYLRLQATDGNVNYFWTDDSDQFRISTNAANIGTTGGTVVGTQTSDERIKNILGSVDYGLDTIKQIEPVRFALKSDPDTEKLGFIAQQVQPLIPQSVFDTGEHIEGEPEDAPTKLGMEYVALIPVLVNAIKELSAEVDALKAQLS